MAVGAARDYVVKIYLMRSEKNYLNTASALVNNQFLEWKFCRASKRKKRDR